MLQENKARQIFQEENISYPLIRTRACGYQGLEMFVFRKIWRALYSCNTRFEILPFPLLPTTHLSVREKMSEFEVYSGLAGILHIRIFTL